MKVKDFIYDLDVNNKLQKNIFIKKYFRLYKMYIKIKNIKKVNYNSGMVYKLDTSPSDVTFAPMPQCQQGTPFNGFYTEFDFIADNNKYSSTPVTDITNYTCSNNTSQLFLFVCESGNKTGAEPSCITANGGSYFGSGLIQYQGTDDVTYKITVSITHSYLAPDNTYDANGTNYNLSDYNTIINYTGSGTYKYTPGLEIYVDSSRNGKLDCKQAYGGKGDDQYIHDPDLSTYPPITFSQTYKLGTKNGTQHDQLHFKVINCNNKTIRFVGNIYIVEA